VHCKRCNSTYIKSSRRNRLERAIGMLLPVNAYRCGTCFERFHGLAKPVFNLARTLTTGLIVGILIFSLSGNLVSKQTDLPPLAPGPKTAIASYEPEAKSSPSNQMLALQAETPDPHPAANVAEGGRHAGEPDNLDGTTLAEPATLVDHRREQPQEPDRITPDPTPGPATETDAGAAPPSAEPEPRAVQANQNLNSRHLESLHIDQASGTVTVVLSGTNVAESYDDHLSDSGRIIIDLPGRWRLGSNIKKEYALKLAGIKRLRTGSHPGFFRLVFDRDKNGGGSYQIHPSPAGLTIVLSRP